MSGIGIVFNPRSRRNLRDPKAATRLARALGDHGVVREARSRDELHRIAEDFANLGIEILGISGGDGTNHVTITGFLDVYGARALPQLAFLRGGTMNTVANSVGISKGKPEGLLGHLIRAYAERASRPLANVERHVMKIGDAAESHYGFLFGTGVVAGFLAEYYANGEPSPLVAAETLLRAVGSTMVGGEMIRRMAKPFRGSVTFEGESGGTDWPERDYLAVAAGTIDQIGLNFRPFRRYAERDGTFHALGIHCSPLQFVRDLPRIWRAEPMRDGRTYEAAVARMTVRAADGHLRYMIDGDLHEKRGPIDVSIGPKVRIIVGT
jgi:diacylglycerol kinase family enzyme